MARAGNSRRRLVFHVVVVDRPVACDRARKRVRCLLLSAYDHGRLVGLAIIGLRAAAMGRHCRRAHLALHQGGRFSDDALYIEYNDILADRAVAGDVRRDSSNSSSILACVRARTLGLGGIPPAGRVTPELDAATQDLPLSREACCANAPGPISRLTGVGSRAYLAAFSRNTRAQAAPRLAACRGTSGPLAVTPRGNRDRADGNFSANLRDLHQRAWWQEAAPRRVRFAARLPPSSIISSRAARASNCFA